MDRHDLALGARIAVQNVAGRAFALAGDPMMRLLFPPWRDRPDVTLARLSAGPPVVRNRLGMVLVVSADLCGQVLRTSSISSPTSPPR